MRTSSAGSDGWRIGELKALPPELINRISELFNVIEQIGRWPTALTLGIVSMLPKGDGLGPSDMRPITVMSTLYRLWSAIRVNSVLQWQEGWASPALMGFRNLLGCEDVFWQMGLDIESALLQGSRLCGLSIDFSKAFDRVPREHVFRLAERLGLPQFILEPLKAMYGQLQRRFKIGGCLSDAFQSTNGILQGCPLSIILLNLLMQVWCNAAESLGADPKCYADDANASCEKPQEVLGLLEMSGTFSRLTGMKLNIGKILVWALKPRDRRFFFRNFFKGKPEEECPKISLGDRLLGAQMQYSKRNPGKSGLTERFQTAEDACTRIESVPLGMYDRGQLVEAVVIPKILFDTCISPLSKRAMNKWRAACARAIWGRGARFRCNENLFTLLCRGHAADPLQASIIRIIKSSKRMLTRYQQHREQLLAVLRVRTEADQRNIMGPGKQLMWALEQVGWVMDESFHVSTRNGRQEFSLLEIDDEFMEHVQREDLRALVSTAAATRRPNELDGIQHGIDREITLGLYNKSTPEDQQVLQCLFTGCVPCRDRKYRIKKHQSPSCFFCRGHPPETLEHILHECPAWDHLRTISAERIAQEPPCTRLAGIACEDPRLRAYEDELSRMPELQHRMWTTDTPQPAWTTTSGHWVVFTDGACERNQHARLRRAGYGAWFGYNHAMNVSAALPGPVQTNQRAELMAVLTVVEACDRCPVDVRTDSQYVFRRACAWREWRGRELKGSHQDLWRRFDAAMQTKTEGQALFSKVKGHATWGGVRQGVSTRQNKIGNAMADLLAVRGASLRPSALPLAEEQEQRKALSRIYKTNVFEHSEEAGQGHCRHRRGYDA